MTCKRCAVQYVGETGGWFSHRNNKHRSAMRCGRSRCLIYQHYHLDEDGIRQKSTFDDFLIQPIEVLVKNTTIFDRRKKRSGG